MKRLIPLFLALVLSGSAIPSLQGAAQPHKTRQAVLTPTEMRFGDTVRTGIPFAKDPTVIRKGGRYYMYYSIPAYSPDRKPEQTAPLQDGWNAGIARSKDLIHWERVGDLDLRDTHGQRIWGAIAPCVKRFGGKIHLFYQRYWDGAGNNNIWHAVSKDGITFTNTSDVPVFVMDAPWALNRAIDAEVYRVKDRLILLFATRDPEGKVQMLGMAHAPYRSDYGPDKWVLDSTDGPLLKPDFEWEGHCIEAPTVLKYKGVWYMFYAGAYNHERQQIGLATSGDGLHFTRIPPEGLLFPAGEEGAWNHGESGHPGVFRDRDGKIYLFFQGKAELKGNYRLSVCRVELR